MITDSLGFRLTVNIGVASMDVRGMHKAYVEEDDNVCEDTPHAIIVTTGLDAAELAEVAAHEAYHLFYSIRHLIVADEETQALVFGQLVGHIHKMAT